jgi:glycerol-3-phosphate dehydrogenase (NAD(P)+)
MKIGILGVGTFGRAMADHLGRLGHEIVEESSAQSEITLVCVPSFAVIDALEKERGNISGQSIVICSKGFASEEKLLSEVLREKFENKIFFLYGPTLADELSIGMLSAMILAGGDGKDGLKKVIESDSLRIELSDDVVGVEVGAALKNVVTIFVGIAEGAGYGQNTQAFIFTKGVEEVQKIGTALGANPNTFIGLSCVGDLTLHSRNRYLGIELGKGRSLPDIVDEMKYTPEGILALKNAKSMAKKLGIKVPFIEDLYSLVFEDKSIKSAIEDVR